VSIKNRTFLSRFSLFLRVLVATIFFAGILPAAALADGNGSFAGHISDNATGNPVTNGTVLVFTSPSSPPVATASTNTSGDYSAQVPAGPGYQVEARAPGLVAQRVANQSVGENGTTIVNFSLLPGGDIGGAITTNQSAPIQGVRVRVFLPASPQTQYTALPTPGNGQYSLTAPPGTGYTVVADATGYISANQTGIEAILGQMTTVNFTLQAVPAGDITPPAAIANLATANVTHNSLLLTWTAPGDDGDTGTAAAYDIRMAAAVIDDNSKFASATTLPDPPAPQASGAPQSFTVGALSANTTYFFAIKARDEADQWSALSNSPQAQTQAPPQGGDFNIAHSQGRSSFMLAAGASVNETFNITSVGGFTGTIELGFGGPPEIQNNSSVSPQQITLTAGQTQSVVLTIGADAMTGPGSYPCAFGGHTEADGGRDKVFFFNVIIGVPGQPLLSASPPMVGPGGQTTLIASQFPGSANITLRWDSGPNSGQTITSGQTQADGTWQFTLDVPGGMPVGAFSLKAISGQAAAVCQLIVTSGEGVDFLISASPQSVSIIPGQSANVTIYVTSVNGFNAAVALTAGQAPGVTRSFSASSVTPAAGQTASAVLTISVADWVSPDMYQINVDGTCASPQINKVTNINLDIQSPAQWGPGISLSQSYAMEGDTITVSGANFPAGCNGQTISIMEAFSNTTLVTNPATITVSNGGFTGTFTIPTGIPSGNYRIRAIVPATGDMAERDFQIFGTGETFNLNLSPSWTSVTIEAGNNASTVSVNIFSMGGSSPSINLALEGVPPWLTYRFGSLADNTPASGNNSVSVPAGGSASRDLLLTASLTAPTGTYSITVKGWVSGGAEQRVSLELSVQPPAGFGMAQVTLSPNFGAGGQNVNFNASGFTGGAPSRVTEITFAQLDLILGQNIPTINVPTTGDSAGRFSGTFRVPVVLPPGTYPVRFRVGDIPNDKIVMKSFTITGPSDTFVLQASPGFLGAEQGAQMHTMVKVQSVGSSSPAVSLALEGLPPDITASFESANITAPPGGIGGTDLSLNLSQWLPAGHYTIILKGQIIGGAELHRFPLELDVFPPAGMGITYIYLSPNMGSQGTWITISGGGFTGSTPLSHLYFGPPVPQNDRISTLPSMSTDGGGNFTAVIQVPPGLTPGMYPVQVVFGDRMATTGFSLVGDSASFNVNLSPDFVQVAPGEPVSISVNIQSFGNSSANVTLTVEGPPAIEWRFDGGTAFAPKVVNPPIGGSIMSVLQVQPKTSLQMGHYGLAVRAVSGPQVEIRNLEMDIGASSAYGMPIFSINPNTGTAGTSVTFSGSNFPGNTPVSGLTFAGTNVTLGQSIATSGDGSFSGAFTIPATLGGQPIAPGTYNVRIYVGMAEAESPFIIYGADDTFILSLSPNFLQSGPGTEARTSGLLKALGGAAPTVKLAVRGLPPGVDTTWNGVVQPVYQISAPPGGQNSFELGLVLPNMIPMGQYPATLEGWSDNISANNAWDPGEKIFRCNLEIAIMPPQGYNMGMLSLTPSYGQVGDTVSFTGSGFPASTPLQSLMFAGTNILSNPITTSDDGSFSGLFTVPATAFGMPTGPGMYPVEVFVGGRNGNFGFQVISGDQKFSVMASPGWLARPAGETAFVNIQVRSLVTAPPSPTVTLRIEGLPMGVTASFTTANITPPFGNMEGRELRLVISGGAPMGNYPISIRAYNAADPAEEMFAGFTLEVTPSSGFMDMGMAMITLSNDFGTNGDQITVSGYGFPKSQPLTSIRLGPQNVTPAVSTNTDVAGAFSAVITVPSLPSGPHPLEVNVQNTIRNIPFQIMSASDTFTVDVSPHWLEPVPAGDPAGRQVTITVKGLPGKTPTVELHTEGLFTPFGTISENWSPSSHTVNVTSAGGSATATLTLVASREVPPGPHPFNIIAVEGQVRRDFHMEFLVGPPAGFMDMNQQGVFFPDIFLSPNSGPAGTQVSYTGINLPSGANVTAINFADRAVPLPPGGVSADGSGGFSGSFIVDEAWNLPPGGMYWVSFRVEKETWWQNIGRDFNVMRADAVFNLEATPNFIPPIPPQGFGQTRVNVKNFGYTSFNVTMRVMEEMNGWGIPGGAVPHWNNTGGPAIGTLQVPAGGMASEGFFLRGANPGHYTITIVGWIDSNANQILDKQIPSEAESEFATPLDFDVQPPAGFTNWNPNDIMGQMGLGADSAYLFYFPEIMLNPNMGPADSKVTIQATDFPAGAVVTQLRFAGTAIPFPDGTAADANGDFTLVFNVPKTIWGGPINSGWYDIAVEAQKAGEPPVFIMKPFQVTSADVAFTLRAEPDWLPPIPTGGSATTLIRVKSTGPAANVTLTMDKIPPGVATSFSTTTVNITAGGNGSATLTLTPTNIPPGHYGAEIKGVAVIEGSQRAFYAHFEFEVQPPQGFMDWNRNDIMNQMGLGADDAYMLYFPEILLNPNMGQAGNKVTVTATDFPAGANVTHLRFAGMELPVPASTAADENGDFTLVFNVPTSIWGGAMNQGWYDVAVEAQKPGEPPVFIMKPFQVTSADAAFNLRAEPDWLPPIPPEGSSTTIRVTSLGAGANVTLTVERIPPGINTSFSPGSQVDVSPGGTASATLTLTPAGIPPGHYGAEIKGTATVNSVVKTFFTHIEFDIQPSQQFMDTDWMTEQGVWFPEITVNPNAGPVKTKVTISATDFPAGANITFLRFAGRPMPLPAGTAADENGSANLVFNVPDDFGVGQYMIEVQASKPGFPPIFIAKPFSIQDAGVTFNINVVPGFLPGVSQGSSGNTTVSIQSTGQAVTVNLYVDGLPPGVTATFESANVTVPPGGSSSVRLTIATGASTPPGQYALTIRGVSGSESRMAPFGFGVMPPANFQMPKFAISPDYAPAGYMDKQYKITFSGTGFPPNRTVSSITFGSQTVAIPANLTTDAAGNFNGVFQMPTGLDPGTYDVRVAVSSPQGGYIYDSRPFSVRGAEAKFILKISPPYLPPVVQGGQGITQVNIQSVGATAANVTLYVDGLGPGITAAFTPASTLSVPPGGVSGATLTINIAASTPPGPYPISIRGVSGIETVTVPLGFGVMPNIGGGEGHATVTINPSQARPGEHIGISGGGFTAGNTITLSAAPPGAAVPINITPGTITVQNDGTWATQITVPPAAQVPPGMYIIKASDGVMAGKTPFSIVPATGADFFLTVSPQFIEVVRGQSGNTTLILSSKNGFKDPVTFSVGHLAPGVTATFKNTTGQTISQFAGMPGGIRELVAPVAQTPVPGEDTVVLVLVDVDIATPIGPSDIALEVGSATVFRSVPLGFMVMSAGANTAISPQAGPADTDIRVSGSGFTSGETIAITFAGSTIATIPASVTAAGDGTFTAVITAPSMAAGIYPVRVTGGTSGIAIDQPFALKPSAVNSFVLYTSPMKVDIPRGGSGTITARIEPLGTFQAAVALSVTGLSAISGASANFTPSATVTPSVGTPTTATLTINVPAGATVGRYPLVVTAIAGAITQTRTVTLNVAPPADTPDFAISLAPNTVPVRAGSSSNTTVSVTAVNGFTGTVALSLAMASANATWPANITYTAGSITPSAATGQGRQVVVFIADNTTQPGTWTIRITGTSGALTHYTDVMVIGTPSGTTFTPFPSPRLDPTTITSSTPMDMTAPWGDKITINGIINDGSEASIITPANINVTPETLADLPAGATDMLGRVTNVESSSPVDGVEWELGFPYDPAELAAAGLSESNLKVAYLDPVTGEWIEVTTTVNTGEQIAYATPDHFSSWTLIGTAAPPPSQVVSGGGGGGGGGASGVTVMSDYVNSSGRFVVGAKARSDDSKVTLDIPRDTFGLNRLGQPLRTVSIKQHASPPSPPVNSRIIGAAYDFGPSGATFDPPVNLTFAYNTFQLPAGTGEENLTVAIWQDDAWVEIEGAVIDADANTITVPVSHFSMYAVIAHTGTASFEITGLKVVPFEAETGESVVVTATITNSGDVAGSHRVSFSVNGEVVATEEIDLAGQASREIEFTLLPDKAGVYTLEVDGTTAELTVREPAAVPKEEPPAAVTPAAPEKEPAIPEITTSAPVTTPPAVMETPAPAAPAATTTAEVPATGAVARSWLNDWLILLGVLLAGIAFIGVIYWRTRARAK
jgi:uncharacterized membrane protein